MKFLIRLSGVQMQSFNVLFSSFLSDSKNCGSSFVFFGCQLSRLFSVSFFSNTKIIRYCSISFLESKSFGSYSICIFSKCNFFSNFPFISLQKTKLLQIFFQSFVYCSKARFLEFILSVLFVNRKVFLNILPIGSFLNVFQVLFCSFFFRWKNFRPCPVGGFLNIRVFGSYSIYILSPKFLLISHEVILQ